MQVYARLGGEVYREAIAVQYVVVTAYERFATMRAYFLHLAAGVVPTANETKRLKWKYFLNIGIFITASIRESYESFMFRQVF
jgi:hypothetical protein